MNADKTTKWNLFSIGQQRTIQKDLIFFFSHNASSLHFLDILRRESNLNFSFMAHHFSALEWKKWQKETLITTKLTRIL